MKTGYRKIRAFVLLLAGLLAIALNHTMDGYAVVFGISLIVSSAFTVLYVFMRFDEEINPKVVMEMIADGFSGLVLFTYPYSDERFLLIVFAFWIVIMGMMYLTSGIMEERNKDQLWAYALAGIMMIVLGFVILNYSDEYLSSVLYLVGFTILIYSVFTLYLLIGRKAEVY